MPLPRGMRTVRQLLPSGSHASSSGSIVVLLAGTMSPTESGSLSMSEPEESCGIRRQHFVARTDVRYPFAEQIEKPNAADLVREGEVRMIHAPDQAVGNRVAQRAHHLR